MMMGAANFVEQRWSQRRSLTLGVDLYVAGGKYASAQTRDVGLGGVFIELGENPPAIQTDVELHFNLGTEESPARHKLNARVVRKEEKGVGLMFRDFDTRSFRALQEIMRQAPAM